MSGFEWVPYAASAAATAASGAYASNQANQTSAGNAYMANMTNMFMQAQNQNYNSAEAAKARDFNADQASAQRDWAANAMHDTQNYNTAEADKGRSFAAGQQLQAQGFNAAEAQKNRDFQAGQSATAYQRAIADMKAAGLNPMLAYSQGGAQSGSGSAASIGGTSAPIASAGAPGGSSASGPAASSGGWGGARVPDVNKIDMLGNFISGALDLKMKEAQINNIEAQSKSLLAGTVKTQKETLNLDQTYEEILQRIAVGKETVKNKQAENELMQMEKQIKLLQGEKITSETDANQARTRASNASARLDELEVPAAEAKAKWATKIDDLGPAIGTAGGIANILKMLLMQPRR